MIIRVACTDVSGVYCIINKTTGRRYVGMSSQIHRRWSDHRQDLSQGSHVNKALQAEWFEFGPEVFNFVILELVQGGFPELRRRERLWMNRLDVWNGHGYNKAK